MFPSLPENFYINQNFKQILYIYYIISVFFIDFFFKMCFNIISALVHCKGGKIMFLDIFNNNEKMYIRISESYRVYSEEKKKFVNRKRTIKNIGPVSKFDDGKENFIERLRASFNAGTPIIKELEPYVSKDIKKEIYNIQIHEGTEECIGHPKLFSNLLLDKLMEEIGLIQYINVYKTYDKITYDVLGFIKLLIYGRLLNPASKIATVNQNDDYYNKIIDDGSYKYNVFDSLDFIYKHKNTSCYLVVLFYLITGG